VGGGKSTNGRIVSVCDSCQLIRVPQDRGRVTARDGLLTPQNEAYPPTGKPDERARVGVGRSKPKDELTEVARHLPVNS